MVNYPGVSFLFTRNLLDDSSLTLPPLFRACLRPTSTASQVPKVSHGASKSKKRNEVLSIRVCISSGRASLPRARGVVGQNDVECNIRGEGWSTAARSSLFLLHNFFLVDGEAGMPMERDLEVNVVE